MVNLKVEFHNEDCIIRASGGELAERIITAGDCMSFIRSRSINFGQDLENYIDGDDVCFSFEVNPRMYPLSTAKERIRSTVERYVRRLRTTKTGMLLEFTRNAEKTVYRSIWKELQYRVAYAPQAFGADFSDHPWYVEIGHPYYSKRVNTKGLIHFETADDGIQFCNDYATGKIPYLALQQSLDYLAMKKSREFAAVFYNSLEEEGVTASTFLRLLEKYNKLPPNAQIEVKPEAE